MNLTLGSLVCALLASLAGCAKPPPPAHPDVHYVLEPAWRGADGAWFYPAQSFSYDATGIATVMHGAHAPLTVDGEAFDPNAMAAASQTLQLPAIAQVTDLATGRQVLVRVNDRGPANPARLIALTPRAAALLGIPVDGAAPVRVQVMEAPSRALEQALHGAAERIAVAAAPTGAVQSQSLPPPPGVAQGGGAALPAGPTAIVAPLDQTGPLPPLRLPEQVTQISPMPGSYWIRGDEFARRDYAQRQQAQLSGLSPEIETELHGRERRYRLRAGPFASVAAADAALDQARRAGVTDARIVVE